MWTIPVMGDGSLSRSLGAKLSQNREQPQLGPRGADPRTPLSAPALSLCKVPGFQSPPCPPGKAWSSPVLLAVGVVGELSLRAPSLFSFSSLWTRVNACFPSKVSPRWGFPTATQTSPSPLGPGPLVDRLSLPTVLDDRAVSWGSSWWPRTPFPQALLLQMSPSPSPVLPCCVLLILHPCRLSWGSRPPTQRPVVDRDAGLVLFQNPTVSAARFPPTPLSLGLPFSRQQP